LFTFHENDILKTILDPLFLGLTVARDNAAFGGFLKIMASLARIEQFREEIMAGLPMAVERIPKEDQSGSEHQFVALIEQLLQAEPGERNA
jgi:hypothetical protein